jgi:hypothetical protein
MIGSLFLIEAPRRFLHVINSNKVFGTHRDSGCHSHGATDRRSCCGRFCQSGDRPNHPIEQWNSPHGTVRHPQGVDSARQLSER